MKRVTILLASGLAASTPAVAQMRHPMPNDGSGCTLCAPWVFAEGGVLYRTNEALPSATSDNWTPLVRAIVEVGTPTRHVGFFTHLEFAPSDGGTPTLAYGAQVWLFPRFQRFNLTGGAGLIHRRNGIGENRPEAFQVRGWGHLGAEYQLPFHEVSLFGEVGTALNGAAKLSYQVGIRHPIAPWRAHLF